MSEKFETVDDIVREARDKYTVHECNECNWRKSCMGRKFGDSECVNERQSISLAFGIEDGYFAGLLDRIESAWRREKAELVECLKNTMVAMCNYCRSTPEAKGLPCLNGCETMFAAKRLIEVEKGGES